MDLIIGIIVAVLTSIASLLTNILAHDICMSADRVCAKIIRRAAHRLAPFDQESVDLEWLGDLSERETVYEKYRHAIGCYIAAGGMRRRAMTVTVALSLRITGVGTVPLSLKIGPPRIVSAYFALTGPKTPRFISKTSIAVLIVYMFFKLFLAARRLGPGCLNRFLDQLKLKQFEKWEFEAHIGRKSLDFNFSNILRAMVLDPKRIPEFAQKVTDILDKKK